MHQHIVVVDLPAALRLRVIDVQTYDIGRAPGRGGQEIDIPVINPQAESA